VFDDPATVASYAFAFRIGERIAISLVIIAVSLVVTRGFWKSIQKVDFTLGQGGVTGGGTLVLATPVFALLALIGFAWVSFSHPVSVTVPHAAGMVQAEAATAVSLIGAVTERPPVVDEAFQRGEAERQIQSLNCLAQQGGASVSPRDVDALAAVKLGLMLSIWAPDWGDPVAFDRWARGLSTAEPDSAARAVFDAVHPLC
jgi:hypothetical protein